MLETAGRPFPLPRWRPLLAGLAALALAVDGAELRAENSAIRVIRPVPIDVAEALTTESTVDEARDEAAEAVSADVPAAAGAGIVLAQQLAAPAEEVEPQTEPTDQHRVLRPITEVTVDATLPDGLLPEQVEREAGRPDPAPLPDVIDMRLAGAWGDSVFEWSATKLCHRPLYFEEINLERYGYQCHPAVQPFVSGAHFFLTVPTLPYQTVVYPPQECIYTLGHYRPGSRVPWQRHYLPWDARAAVAQAGVVVGLVALIP